MQLDKARALLVMAQAKNGMLEVWTVVTTMKFDYTNKQRAGVFVEKRREEGGRKASAATLAPGVGYRDCGPTGTIVYIT